MRPGGARPHLGVGGAGLGPGGFVSPHRRDAATVRRGLDAHYAAGATHVCIQPLHAEGDFASRDAALKALVS